MTPSITIKKLILTGRWKSGVCITIRFFRPDSARGEKLFSSHYNSMIPWQIFKCYTSIQLRLSRAFKVLQKIYQKVMSTALNWPLKTNVHFRRKFNFNFKWKKYVIKFWNSKKWVGHFVEHENTFHLMYNTWGLYEGGWVKNAPKKFLSEFFFLQKLKFNLKCIKWMMWCQTSTYETTTL